MSEYKVLACGICNEIFTQDSTIKGIVTIHCGHLFHGGCFQKFEAEHEVVLRVCFVCKADYAKTGTLKVTPTFKGIQQQQQSESAKSTSSNGKSDNEDVKALKTEIKNLKAQIKKEAKVNIELKKSAELKEELLKSKIDQLCSGIQSLNMSKGKIIGEILDPVAAAVVEDKKTTENKENQGGQVVHNNSSSSSSKNITEADFVAADVSDNDNSETQKETKERKKAKPVTKSTRNLRKKT